MIIDARNEGWYGRRYVSREDMIIKDSWLEGYQAAGNTEERARKAWFASFESAFDAY